MTNFMRCRHLIVGVDGMKMVDSSGLGFDLLSAGVQRRRVRVVDRAYPVRNMERRNEEMVSRQIPLSSREPL